MGGRAEQAMSERAEVRGGLFVLCLIRGILMGAAYFMARALFLFPLRENARPKVTAGGGTGGGN